jgi:hypothetical protein
MQTPILGSSYVARSVNAADNRMVNLFPEVLPEGGQTAGFLNRAPGLRLLTTVGTGPIRALWTHQTNGADAYVVSGNQVYKLYNGDAYTAVLLGTITSNSGPVSIADNGTQLFFACNPDGFIYNESTDEFKQISDPDFPGAVTVGYLDGYFVFNEPNSQKVWVTELLDGTSIDPLGFASAEGSPDGLVSVNVNQREAWLFGTDTIEVWYDAGTVPFPLTRIQGAFNEVGCMAPFSVAKLDNTLFWLGTDARGYGVVYKAQGYTGRRVSTHAVEYAIQNYGNISDAIAYSYQQEGHAFYVITFPSADRTWVYDAATTAWHERAGLNNGEFVRHRSNCQMNYLNQTIVGDYENGNLYAFDLDVYKDNTTTQKWLRAWRALAPSTNTLNRSAQHSLQLIAETGVGLQGRQAKPPHSFVSPWIIIDSFEIQDQVTILAAVDNYVEPQAMLRWSDDGGHTWSNEHWTSMGTIGSHGTRTIWRRLGMTLKLRDRVYEVSGSDPVKVAIMGAELHVSGTNA